MKGVDNRTYIGEDESHSSSFETGTESSMTSSSDERTSVSSDMREADHADHGPKMVGMFGLVRGLRLCC